MTEDSHEEEHVVVILAIVYEETTTMHLGASLEIPMHGALAVKDLVTLHTTVIEDIKSPNLHPAFRTGAPINKILRRLRLSTLKPHLVPMPMRPRHLLQIALQGLYNTKTNSTATATQYAPAAATLVPLENGFTILHVPNT